MTRFPLAWLVALHGGVMLGLLAFGWVVAPGVALVFGLVKGALAVSSAILLLMCLLLWRPRKRAGVPRPALPLQLHLGLLAVAIAAPLDQVRENLDFAQHRSERLAAVETARAAHFKAPVFAEPAPGAPQLVESEPGVRFQLTGGCFGDCWGGFVFLEGKGAPTAAEGSAFDVRRLEDHWFWVDALGAPP